MAENVVTIIPHNDGPHEVKGRLEIVTEGGRVIQADDTEAWLCRCGQSASKPFCDGTHAKVGFRSNLDAPVATGDGYADVCAEGDVKEGDLKGVRVSGQPVVLGRFESRIYAIGGVCTHKQALLEEGELDGVEVHCPLHGAIFDIRDGTVLGPPATEPEPSFETKVEKGRVLVSKRQQ